MAKKGQVFRKYNEKERYKIVMEYIDKGIQASELEKQYGINTNTINTWVYKYRHKGQLKDERGRPKESEIDYKERYEILKNYQAFLKEQRERK
jgi:transposase-like protein